MKKFYIILFTLLAFNGANGQRSIPALPLDASAQRKHPAFDLQHATSNSLENVQGMTGNREWETPGIFTDKGSRELINHRTPQQRSLIQIYNSIYYWNWNELSIGWEIDYKITDMVYDANNNQTSELHQKWNGSIVENEWQYTWTYDANNNLTSELYQNWNGSAWENYLLYTCTYDANNNQTSQLHQEWNGSAWENYLLYTYTYDANNNQTSQLHQGWNGSAWENYLLYTYTYDANNNQTSQLYQGWNGSTWENEWQDTYTYDANNNLTSRLYQEWNGSAWENYLLYTYTYDTNSNLTSGLYQGWNGSTWENYSLYTNTYDADNFMTSESERFWNDDGTIITGDSTRYYFHTVVGINDLIVPLRSLTVYPSPTSATITIELSNTTAIKNTYLTIYNLNGQQLITRRITEPKTDIDISGLQKGVYFVRVHNDQAVMVEKIIKQ